MPILKGGTDEVRELSARIEAIKKDLDFMTLEQTEFAPGVVTVIPPAPDPKETIDGPSGPSPR